ncbi:MULTISPECIES: hypothetical protein [Luteimonas]|uniref:hypothetical protein n=1 Tax=Luteimonas TaxID=83614 RepID=UPI00117C5735|nr:MULTISPECIES: hypothetical protein [Luteimonas]
MPLTISLSGMDSATETALRAAFTAANARLGGRCELLPDGQAEYVIVDMDSMYGPMSWLRLHAAGKQIIGLTSAPRVQTHYRLGRPFDDAALAALLQEIDPTLASATDAPAAPRIETPGTAQDSNAAAPAPAPSPVKPEPPDAAPVVEVPAPVSPLPAAVPAESHATPTPDVEHTNEAPAAAATPDIAAPVAVHVVPLVPPTPDRDPVFADWLVPGALQGRLRYRRDTGPTLWLDADAQQYFGPTTLKPLTQYFSGSVRREDFEAVADDAWARDTADAGAPQPQQRLQWLAGLLADDADLLVNGDSPTRFTLNKWPQTEREYPRHFRIATAMMRGPATIAEVIAASGVPADEVVRFVNASLATGHAEPVADPAAEPLDTAKKGGFFSRLRRG